MCDCIKKINEALKPMFTKMGTVLVYERETNSMYSTFDVRVEKTDDAPRRHKPVGIVPSYCCFCGEKIRQTIEKERVLAQ